MTQHDLLTALETWPGGSTAHDYPSAVLEAVPLMRLAAAEIRRLTTAENDLASLLNEFASGRGQRILDVESEAGL
jgi:hypothetical protein